MITHTFPCYELQNKPHDEICGNVINFTAKFVEIVIVKMEALLDAY